jgi:cell division septation protein DedD
MKEIDQRIGELLYDHDCVIVPDLGGFLASYSGSSIHPVLQTIYPPSRKVAFNVYLMQNDGLLANHVSGLEHTTYLDAVKKIEAYAAACQRELQAGKRVVIEGVGILFHDAEHNTQFEAAPAANFLKDSFGLSPIRHLPLEKEERQKQVEVQRKELVTIRPSVKPKAVKPVLNGKSKKRLSRVIVGAAVVWLGVNIFLVLKDNKENIAAYHPVVSGNEAAVTPTETLSPTAASQASVQPPANTESTAAFLNIPESVLVEKQPAVVEMKEESTKQEREPLAEHVQRNFTEKEILAPTPPAPVRTTPTQAAPAQETPVQVVAATSEKKYFVIAGAFKIPANASSFVAQLQSEGFANAHIIQSESKFTMVCYDAVSSRKHAIQLLDSIRSKQRDGWVKAN